MPWSQARIEHFHLSIWHARIYLVYLLVPYIMIQVNNFYSVKKLLKIGYHAYKKIIFVCLPKTWSWQIKPMRTCYVYVICCGFWYWTIVVDLETQFLAFYWCYLFRSVYFSLYKFEPEDSTNLCKVYVVSFSNILETLNLTKFSHNTREDAGGLSREYILRIPSVS